MLICMKKNNISILKAFKVLLPMYIKAAPFKVVMSVILGFLLGFNIFAKAIATQIFFDSATNLSNGTTLINSTILAGLFLAFIFILSDILSVTSSVLNSYLFEKTAGYITNFINRKVSKIESINFERSERLDGWYILNKYYYYDTNHLCSIFCIYGYVFIQIKPYFDISIILCVYSSYLKSIHKSKNIF